jgi:hypothetical protein
VRDYKTDVSLNVHVYEGQLQVYRNALGQVGHHASTRSSFMCRAVTNDVHFFEGPFRTPSPRWPSDSRNHCQAFVTRTRAVTTVGAVSSYSLRVSLCDSAPARYSFGTDDFFSDDDLRRSVSILASGISSTDMRDSGKRRKQRSSARSKERLVRSGQKFSLFETASELSPEAHGPGVYHVFLVRRWAGRSRISETRSTLSLAGSRREACELYLVDPAYLELFARIDAPEGRPALNLRR